MEYQIEAMGARRWARGCEVLAALFLWLAAMTLPAADLTRSVTFTDGQRLTAAQLHSLIDGASINVAFLTGKSLLGTVDSADFVLIYDTSAGTFKKMTLATLITANTDLITTQSEESNPAANDYLLLYDTSGTQLAKVSVTNLITGNTNLILAQLPITNLLSTAQFLVSNGGTNNRIRLDHLWANNFEYTRGFTNQLQHTAPTNVDRLLIWDATAGTNKWTTLSGLVTNLPAAANPTNTAKLLIVETGEVKQASIDVLRTSLTQAAFLSTNQTYTSSTIALSAVTGDGQYLNAAHGLGVKPKFVRCIMTCTTADNGYAVDDDVDAGTVDFTNSGAAEDGAAVVIGSNATNCWISVQAPASGWLFANKTTGATVTPTAARWNLQIIARP